MKRFNVLVVIAVTVASMVVGRPADAKEAKESYEVAIIANQDKMIPDEIFVPSDQPLVLLLANSQKQTGTLMLNFDTPEETVIKKNKVQAIVITPKEAGSYDMEFTPDNGGAALKAKIIVGNTEKVESNHIAILAEFKKIKPEVTTVMANVPTTISFYSTVSIPHGDIGLYGTDITFPLKSKKITTVELKEGLKPGEYTISRPGHPKAKHGIKSKIVAQ